MMKQNTFKWWCEISQKKRDDIINRAYLDYLVKKLRKGDIE